jgi:hypothetical protein
MPTKGKGEVMAGSERANKPDADRSLFREADTVMAGGRLLAYGLFCGIVFPGVLPGDECPIGIPLTVARLRRVFTGFRFPQRNKTTDDSNPPPQRHQGCFLMMFGVVFTAFAAGNAWLALNDPSHRKLFGKARTFNNRDHRAPFRASVRDAASKWTKTDPASSPAAEVVFDMATILFQYKLVRQPPRKVTPGKR